MSKTAIFLSVRDKATRLPGKVMRPIHGRPAIVHLIDRLKVTAQADMVVMTTSTHPGDDGLEQVALANGIACFRGSPEDKLVRYRDAAEAYGVEFATIVDGDDILCDAMFADRIISAWRADGGDYIICGDLPCGITPYGIRIEALKKVCEIKGDSETEVWGGYFTDTGLFTCRELEVEPEFRHPEWRMTLDYQPDLDFFTRVFDELYKEGEVFRFPAVAALLHAKPEIVEINREMQQHFQAGWEAARRVVIKDEA